MRLRRHALRPSLESCESRALLSGGPVSAQVPVGVIGPNIHFIQLDGALHGHYHVHNGLPDTGASLDLSGTGRVHGFGHAFITGHIQGIGFIAQGHAQGTLFLSGVKGTLTLQLTGPDQKNGPNGDPNIMANVFTYQVTGGTGAYTNDTDSGTVVLGRSPGTGANQAEHGHFTLNVTSFPVPFV